MSASGRDDFSAADIRVLGERAAYICSIGPHSDPDKSLKTGKACHIRAASEGGPRYDPNQTAEERSDISNGIWLCSNCSDRIDKDPLRFVVDTLLDWRRGHEDWLRSGGIVPQIPKLILTTLHGLTVPNEPGEVKLDPNLREHTLVIANAASTELLMIEAEVFVGEPILKSFGRYKPIGVNAGWEADLPQMVVSGTPGAGVSRSRGPLPTNHYHLQIDRLPPGQRVEIGFLTSRKPWDEHDFTFDSPLWEGMNDPPATAFYIDGKFQFEYHGARLTKKFFAPIEYDKEKRTQSLREVRDDYGPWRPVRGFFWS
jgi:hypothetical protein